MQVKKVLSRDEKKKLEKIIKEKYGCDIDIKNFIVFLTGEDKIWIANGDFDTSLLKDIKRIYSMGLYFGRLKRNDKIKLSIEGSNLIGKKARKNLVELDKKEAEKFMLGMDVKPQRIINSNLNEFVIVRHGDYTLGSGLLRDGFVENLTPKARRISLNI
ncbi:MAG: hypothetical protein J7K87_01900 [Candidatus Aenigmarchaeota archaeon]|nr:hypothetical protein [Candidatus Aenigmarchaeota archaeon]